MTGASLADVVAHLDELLRIREVPDEPNAVNGLQVENHGRIGRIIAAVDASQATIDQVVSRAGADPVPPLLIVHHGLFWDGNQPVRGRRYRRLAALLEHDVAVYSAHIPLDVHPEFGNNAVLAGQLGLTASESLDWYKGVPIGVQGVLEPEVTRDELVRRLERLLDSRARLIPGGPDHSRRVGIITGAAGGRIGAARDAGLDTFITGEGPHHSFFDAMELGVNVIYGGHYATEQVGVKAVAAHLADRFQLPWEFHHHPTGL
jgi:dinuclear metal center YbgI/SA1388 family protein